MANPRTSSKNLTSPVAKGFFVIGVVFLLVALMVRLNDSSPRAMSFAIIGAAFVIAGRIVGAGGGRDRRMIHPGRTIRRSQTPWSQAAERATEQASGRPITFPFAVRPPPRIIGARPPKPRAVPAAVAAQIAVQTGAQILRPTLQISPEAKLIRLKAMHEKALITKEEYDAKRKAILEAF